MCAAQVEVRPHSAKWPQCRDFHRQISPIKSGPQPIVTARGRICARMPIVLPLSATGRSHLGNPGSAVLFARIIGLVLRMPGIRKTFFQALACLLLVVCVAGAANSQDLTRIVLSNRSSESLYLTVYDTTCRRRVFRGSLGRGNNVTIKVCANDRGRGNIVVSDTYRRELRCSNIGKGSRVSVRYPRNARR